MEQEARDKEILEAYLADWQEHGEPRWDRIADALPHIELSQRQLRRIARAEYKKQGHKDSVVSERFDDINDASEYPPDKCEVTFRIDGDTAIAHSSNPQIKTVQQLLSECEVDLELWEVRDYLINAWGMGRKNEKKHFIWENGVIVDGNLDDTGGWAHLQNFQVKVWLKPRKIRPIELVLNELTSDLASVAPEYNFQPLSFGYSADDDQYLFVPSIFDAHFNKRSQGWSLEKAAHEYKKIVDLLISKTIHRRMPVKEVLYIPGQDMLNADSLNDTTTHGTWVESCDDLRVAVDAICEVSTYAVEQFSKLAPVTVLPVAGNHDRYGIYWLGKFLEARFANHNYVRILNNVYPRKYFVFGNNLIGVDHGDKVKPSELALTMAVEAPQDWSQTVHREFLRGHFHKATDMYFSMTTEKGIMVRIMPSLCPPDMWHILHGFIGNRRYAEGLFYHETNGYDGSFNVFVDELERI